ncbi:MAG: CusA/CzcA family heavy metal efflux RND transporter [Burkholderiales bacterium]
MSGWLVGLSLRQPLLVIAFTLALIGGGWSAWQGLPIDAFPDVSSTQVKVIIKAPGMTPEEIEQRITTPIELEMLGIPHKRLVRSVSKYAIADITVDFDDGTDVYWARQQVAERLSGLLRELPPGASGGLAPLTTPLGEMVMFTLESDRHSLQERRTVLDWVIRPALRTLPGVADVNALGGEVRSLEVVPDPALLNARGITLDALRQAIIANNRNDGAGRLVDGEDALLVRIEGSVRTAEDLRQTVVRAGPGAPVRIADLASVRVGNATRYGAVTADGRGETVQGLVLGLRGANAREVVRGVRERLNQLAPTLPEGMTLRVFLDRTELIDRAVGTVARALGEAVVLVLGVLVLLLGNLRAALVVAISLPLSILAAMLLMRWAGLSANLMSLGGLAIGIGLLVDAAVVVVEHAATRLAQAAPQAARAAVVKEAVAQVATPVVAGIAIIAVVFLPLLTLEGLEGKLFSPVALTIVFALAGSLALAFTLVPVLCVALLRPGAHADPWLVARSRAGYARLLDTVLARPLPALVLALGLLAGAAAVLPTIGRSFMPTLDEGSLIVQVQKSTSISLEESGATDLRIQQALLAEVPEITAAVARAGSDDLGLDPMGLNESDLFLVLAPRDRWRGDKQALQDAIRAVMERFPGVAYGFTQPIEMRVSEMLTGSRGDLALKVFGPELAANQALAQRIAERLRALPGARDVMTARHEGLRYLSVRIDRAAAGRAGFTVDALQDRLRAQLEGEPVGLVLESGRRVPLLLRGADDIRGSPQAFGELSLTAPDGHAWPIGRLARLEQTEGPVRIDHENASRFAMVQVAVEGRDLAGFVQEAQALVAREERLAPGMRLLWGGQFENQQRATARLAIVLPVSLGLIFLLLVLSLGSMRQSLLVLANVPFAAVGGVLALRVSGEYLSVPASVGFIALLGIAVLNGLVMITQFNQLLAEGRPLAESVREGALRRLRPVLMTAAITALGMVPLLLATGPGSEIQRPLAVVVTGGLVSATLLTLVLMPMLFARFGVARSASGPGDAARSSPP